MDDVINQLNPKDRELFSQMEKKYCSEKEREFFEIMRYKQEHLYTSANDLVFHENDNDDSLYLVRVDFDEYVLGYAGDDRCCEDFHSQSLSDVLSANLKELGLCDKDITLLEWLREKDYGCVVYNKNYDWL